MAFIYNLTDTWNDGATTWNGIKLAVTNTLSDSSSKLLNLTVSGATTASFTVDKSGNLDLNGKINKITFTAPATAATFTLADNSTFATVGGYATTFTFSGVTSLTFPTSGTVTALGNTTTGTGSIVLANGPTMTLTNATGLPITGVTGLGTGVGTWLVTPSSANLAAAVTDETGSGSLVFGTSPTISSPTLNGTATFNGATSGSVAVKAPAIAGSTTFQLPSGNGSSGYVLVTDGLGNTSWAASGGAVGSAAGLNKNIQFNDAGAMAGNSAFNFDKTTAIASIGIASTTSGKFALYNSASANAVTIASGNNSVAWTMTLPTSAGTSGYVLSTDGSGNTSWVVGGSGITVNTTTITGGTTGRVLYDNAGTVGELTTTGSGSVVLATSPTLVTPVLGTPSSGTLTSCTGLPISTGVSGLGTGVATALAVNVGSAGAPVINGGALGTPSSGTLTSCTGLPISTGVSGLGTGVATAAANTVNASGGFITYSTYAPASGKTLTVSNSITLAGTDSTTMTFPSTSSSIGYLNIPQNSQTGAYVAVVGDVGKHISITTGGVTVNASVFSAGDVFTIFNNSGSSQTITAGASVTFRLSGTATTGNRTLAQYGLATVLCVTGGATPTFIISGAGVT